MYGDAAEQVVRMSLEGVEVVAKISGEAAKDVAVDGFFLGFYGLNLLGKGFLKGERRYYRFPLSQFLGCNRHLHTIAVSVLILDQF